MGIPSWLHAAKPFLLTVLGEGCLLPFSLLHRCGRNRATVGLATHMGTAPLTGYGAGGAGDDGDPSVKEMEKEP